MDAALLQQQLEALTNKVLKMRHYQREYFRHRCSRDLDNAKKYEREVDALVTNEKKQNPQQKMF